MTTDTDGGGRLRRALRRIGASADQVEAVELQQQTLDAGCSLIANCAVGSKIDVTGTLRTVTLRPQGGVPALEAELYDGSGRVRLVWLGRRQITGVAPGRAMTAHGRLTNQRGVLTVYNPAYELRA